MADIIDMEIAIHGQITSVAAFKALTEAMKSNLDEYEDDIGAARQALLDANLADEGLVISAEARNGDVDAIKAAAVKHKIDITVLSGEGPGWGASTYFVRDGYASFELPVVEGEIAVTTEVIDKLMARGITQLEQLKGLIDVFKTAGDQPRFGIADEVITEMFLPKRKR